MIRFRSVLVLCMCLGLQISASAWWAQDGGSLNVNPAAAATVPDIVILNNGTVNAAPCVAWCEGNTVFVKTFDNSNQTWTLLGKFWIQDLASVNLALVNNRPYVIYQGVNATSHPVTYVKHFDGSSWVSDGGQLNASDMWDNPRLASDGSAFCATLSEYNPTNIRPRNVYALYLSGSTWTSFGSGTYGTPLNLDTTYPAYFPDIAVYQGEPYVIWCETTSSGYCAIRAAQWVESAWKRAGDALNVNLSLCTNAIRPSICVVGGIPYAAWAEPDASKNMQIWVKHYTGSTWVADGSARLNDTADKKELYPRIANNNGVPYVAWTENVAGAYQLCLKYFDGTLWKSKDISPETSAISAQMPSLAVGNNLPYVAWQAGSAVPTQIRVEHHAQDRLSWVSPNHALAGQVVKVVIDGSPVHVTPTARLINGGTVITGTNPIQISPAGFAYTFDLTQAAANVYDVTVTASGENYVASLKQAFSVFAPGGTSSWILTDLNGRVAAGSPTLSGEASEYCQLAVGDADADGIQELYVASDSLWQLKQYSYAWTRQLIQGGSAGNNYTAVGFAGVQNDGSCQVLSPQLSNQVFAFSGGAWNVTPLGSGAGNNVSLYSLAAADMNQDGWTEIYATGSPGVVYQFSNTSGAWSEMNLPANAGSAAYSLAVGDGNNDGTLELYSANADYYVHQYQRDGAGNWSVSSVGGATGAMCAVVVGDGDNDGKNEVYAASQDGKLYRFRWNGTGWASSTVFQAPVNGNALYSLVISDGGNTGKEKIYAACLDQHVYECQWGGGVWASKALPDTGTPLYAVTAGDASNNHSNKVYALGKNNHVFEYAWATPTATPTPVVTATAVITASPTAVPLPTNYFGINHNQINPNHGENATIRWIQPQNGPVTITIYNLLGEKIVTLLDNHVCSAGQYNQLNWDGRSKNSGVVGSGIYLVVFQAGNYQARGKIAVVK